MVMFHVLRIRYLLCFVLLKATVTPFLGAQDVIPKTHAEGEGRGGREAGQGRRGAGSGGGVGSREAADAFELA